MRTGDTGIGKTVVVGVVLKTVGLKGELKIKPLTDNPDRYSPGKRIWVQTPKGPEDFTIAGVRETKGNFVVSLEGVTDIDRAEQLRGLDVFVPESEVPPLPDGEYYHYQILGLPVYNYKGILLGKVVDIFTAGVKDVYVVKEQGKEYMIPVNDDTVDEIDVKGGRITLKRMKGYLPEDEV